MSADSLWFIRLYRQGSPLTPEREVRSLPCPRSQATEVTAKKMLKENYFGQRSADAVQIIDHQREVVFTYTLQQFLVEPSMYQRGIQAYRAGRPRDDSTVPFDRDGELADWLSGWDHGKAVDDESKKREQILKGQPVP